MELHPSAFWFDGACFKCTHYALGQGQRKCTKHNVEIHGDCGQKCDDYELSKERWYSERVQKWEHDKGFDKPVQTTLEAF